MLYRQIKLLQILDLTIKMRVYSTLQQQDKQANHEKKIIFLILVMNFYSLSICFPMLKSNYCTKLLYYCGSQNEYIMESKYCNINIFLSSNENTVYVYIIRKEIKMLMICKTGLNQVKCYLLNLPGLAFRLTSLILFLAR